jgi:hypothetical protein
MMNADPSSHCVENFIISKIRSFYKRYRIADYITFDQHGDLFMKRKRSLFGTLQLDLPPALHLGGLFALGAVDRSKGSQGQHRFGRLVQPGPLSFAISGRGASRSFFGAPRSRRLSIFASIPRETERQRQ